VRRVATLLFITVAAAMLAIDAGVIAACVRSSRWRPQPLRAGWRRAADVLGLAYLVLLAAALALLVGIEFTKPWRTSLSGVIEFVLLLFPLAHFAILIVAMLYLFRKPQLVAAMAASAIGAGLIVGGAGVLVIFVFQSGPDFTAGMLAALFAFGAFACGPVVGLPLGWRWLRRTSEKAPDDAGANSGGTA